MKNIWKTIFLFFGILLCLGAFLCINGGNKQISDEKLKEEIGQMIMIGFRGTEADKTNIGQIIKDVKVGGVVLSDYDVPSKSFPRNILNPEQTKKLIEDIQKYSATPMFVGVDAEGGAVNRLQKKYGFVEIPSAEAMAKDITLQTIRNKSIELADELNNLGFNMNLAPVVDVNVNPESPVIGALGRSFSADAKEVVALAKVFIQNHLNDNVITVAKHFPGHGSATKDTHLGSVDVTKTYKEIELQPYQDLNNEGLLDAIMVGHITNRNVDEKYPATLSSNFLQGILRDQIGFKGVIISDDLEMSAISDNYTLDETVVRAINAGCDIVYFFNNSPKGYDENLAYKIQNAILKAVKDNKISRERMTESYNRILNLKKKFRIIQPTAEEVGKEEFQLLSSQENLNKKEAIDIAKHAEGLTGVRAAFLLGILQQELALEKTDMCYLTDLKIGAGVRVADGKKLSKVMKPERDIKDFLAITEELGKDPLKTQITCPMSYGWGGAMGPADFIASTWMRYKDKIEKITGKSADPWNIEDAILAEGLYLADIGANGGDKNGEKNAAMIYFSNTTNPAFSWYADSVLKIAEKLEADIKTIENWLKME